MAFLTLWFLTLHRLKGVAEMIDAYLSIARLLRKIVETALRLRSTTVNFKKKYW